MLGVRVSVRGIQRMDFTTEHTECESEQMWSARTRGAAAQCGEVLVRRLQFRRRTHRGTPGVCQSDSLAPLGRRETVRGLSTGCAALHPWLHSSAPPGPWIELA